MAIGRNRRNGRSHTVLFSYRRPSHSCSLCYCDYKIFTFNDVLFSFGHKHARFLRLWFSIGVVFSFITLMGVVTVLLCQSTLSMYSLNLLIKNVSADWSFGFASLVPGSSTSFAGAGYILCATFISVATHEIGHALAAASVGVRIEYIALFLAVIFPGALIALDYDLLKSLPRCTTLRIYCAGIWHNALCCAVSWLALFFLPSVLYPLYLHGEHPMVLSVFPSSPLFGYLTHGDVILSVDGSSIHDPQEWMEKMAGMDFLTLQNLRVLESSRNSREGSLAIDQGKGYCIPSLWLGENKKIPLVADQLACPEETAPFLEIPCFSSSSFNLSSNDTMIGECLIAKDVVKFKSCVHKENVENHKSICSCSQDEVCMSPIQMPGSMWVEITYSNPLGCSSRELAGRNMSLDSSWYSGSDSSSCMGHFVFIGDTGGAARSVQLTSYQPRWRFLFSCYLPDALEKLLLSTFYVSATLGLLNSMPLFFLDGACMLEASLSYLTWLSRRRRRQLLRLFLWCGTLLSIVTLKDLLFKSSWVISHS
ncbi:hypothetical protein AMTRI_Chr01g134710 [Amborella trichopoda]